MKKLNYITPAVNTAQVELEQGIAVGSPTTPNVEFGQKPTIEEYEEGSGGSVWDVDGF